MKKNYYLIGGILLSMLLTTPNVLASTSAFSVGSKYASTIDSTQSDFTQNVINAAQGYYPHSTLTASYYTNNPKYSYINGTKLGGSRVWFINGHANYNLILTAAQDSTEYRTGIALYTSNPYNYTSSSRFNNKVFKLVGIGNRSFAPTNIVTFAGCSTDAAIDTMPYSWCSDNTGYDTITKKANTKGAKVSVGFTCDITSRFDEGPKWLKKYNYSLGAGNSVDTAIKQANSAYPNSDLSWYVNFRGNSSTSIGTTNTNSINPSLESVDDSYGETKVINANIDMNEYAEVRMSIDDLYESISKKKIDTIDLKNMNTIILEDLKKYENKFKPIIEEIKKYDKDFNINDYKVVYRIIGENEGFGYINFIYYIDGKIETNKVYSASINNYLVTSINLVGVKKTNINKINKINEINEADLTNRINTFEKNKLNNILHLNNIKFKKSNNILKDNMVNIEAFDNNVRRIIEKYYYNYNDSQLQYKLFLYTGFQDDVKDVEEHIINL